MDKRLLIIDEFSGVSEEDVAKLSDIRSTGIAEITKIRTERASARTRLIMMSNTRDGLPLGSYNTGAEALKEVFGHAEDVRRLDFAICVASGEVNVEELNATITASSIPHTYTNDLSRNLILWGWSRTPEQVIITDESTQLILRLASELSAKYSSYIPLIESADTRIKLARLSVACACRCFSADDNGNIVVLPEHVQFIHDFLRTCYDSPYMAYDIYSEKSKTETAFIDGEMEEAVREFGRLVENKAAADILSRLGNPFRMYELSEQLDMESYETRGIIQFLSKYKMIQTLPVGYKKQPKMNTFLRYMENAAKAKV
jgi:hypothetical protein